MKLNPYIDLSMLNNIVVENLFKFIKDKKIKIPKVTTIPHVILYSAISHKNQSSAGAPLTSTTHKFFHKIPIILKLIMHIKHNLYYTFIVGGFPRIIIH